MEKMSKSRRKQFAFTATHPAPLILFEHCGQAWKKTAFRFKRPRARHEYFFWWGETLSSRRVVSPRQARRSLALPNISRRPVQEHPRKSECKSLNNRAA